MYKEEYKFAQEHSDIPECKLLLSLAKLYSRHPDMPTLGLIQGAVEDVRKVMKLHELV